jgi:hypothetical protein
VEAFTDAIADVDAMIENYNLDPKVVRYALNSAIRRTLGTIRSSIGKDVYKASRTRYRLIRKRLHFYSDRKGDPSGKLVSYTHRLPAILLGYGHTATGIRAGSFRYKRAFIYDGKRRKKILARPEGKGRYPLYEPKVPLYGHFLRAVDRADQGVDGIFMKNLRHEIYWRSIKDGP